MGKKNEKEEKQVQDVASEEKVDKKEAVDTTKDIENLKKDLQQKEEEAKNNLESLQRIMAEFDNYKKRTSRERENLYTEIKADIMEDFLEIVDNLDMAIASLESDANLKEGIVLVQKKLLELLGKYGVEEIECLNKTFDPNLHESVQHIDDENYGEKEIIQVFRKGYKLGEKVIRYSMVKVAN